MVYKHNSTFSIAFIKELEITGLGTLVSVKDLKGCDILTVDIGPLEIPQYPVIPVKRFERVEIIASDDAIPDVHCRGDFPVVPHLNVFSDDEKTLCLFDVSFEDIKYMFNANMFLRRIVYWFEQTARGKLHQPNQPLEPYFPGARDGLILPLTLGNSFVRLKRTETSRGTLYQSIPLTNTSEGQVYPVLEVEIQKVYSENIINKMPKTLGDLDEAFEKAIVEHLEEYIPRIWQVKQTPEYEQLFQLKETKLRSSSIILVIHVLLSRTKGGEPERRHIKAFKLAENFQKLYEAFGYKKDTKGKLIKYQQFDNHTEVALTPYEVLYSFERITAFLCNERRKLNINENYVQVGLGALGSQVANNCIRSGYGKWTYIDPDVLCPHNLARHCLGQESIGENKAQAMQSYANSLSGGHDPSVVKAIPYGVFDKDAAEEIAAAITASALVVDCSASIAVGRYISHKLAGNTRAVSFFMNPSGTSLIMLLESSSRSTRLDTLEMQYYRMLIRESALSEHLKSDQRVLYASTCRGTSLVYPQDNAAIFSGFCSKAIKETQISEEASVSIWVVNGLALERYEELGEIFEEVACDSWHMKISPTVLEKLYSQRENKLPNETGGILIGTYDFAHNICYIVDSIDSPSDSEEYPNAYIRGHNGLKDEVMRIENISIGNLTYVGEWHSHPSNDTRPSGDDLILLKSISEFTYSQGNPGCMMILGERNYSIHLGCR